jgi:hypothetical protein
MMEWLYHETGDLTPRLFAEMVKDTTPTLSHPVSIIGLSVITKQQLLEENWKELKEELRNPHSFLALFSQ